MNARAQPPSVPRRRPRAASEPPLFSFAAVRTATLKALTGKGNRPATKVVIVTAPIGYGKTVLLGSMYEHFRRHGGDVGWFALDDRDVTVDHLLTRLEAAYEPGKGEIDLIQAMHQGDDSLDDRIELLLARLDAREGPTTLFIDNLNYCADHVLARLLDALVFRTGAHVNLILSSTTVQKFNATRARLQGLSTPIGLADLSLNRDATSELLGTALCARLSPQSIDSIVRQTEGWPAAIRLMQILLVDAVQPDVVVSNFSGMDEDIASLLNRQVLEGFDPDLRRFLLKVSLLRRFDAELAAHACDDQRAAEHLNWLWQQSLFMIPVDRNRSAFRFHTLFGEYLRGEAKRELAAAERRGLLRQAADYCTNGARWDEAIGFALDADATELAAEILERMATLFVRDRGDLRLYVEWVERLHARGERGGWETDYWYVWALVFHRRYESARRQVARLVARLDRETTRDTAPDAVAVLRRRVEVIQIALDAQTDHLDDMSARARQWLQRDAAIALVDDPFDVTIVACAAAIHEAAADKLLDARRHLSIAKSNVQQSQNPHGMGWVAVVGTLVPLREGEYAATYAELMDAYQRSRAALGENAGICGLIALLTAKCAVEMNMKQEAEMLLVVGLRKVLTHGILDIVAYGLDAAVKLWQGEDTSAIAVSQLRQIAAAYPPRLALMLSCFMIRRFIRLGRVRDAEQEAGHIGLFAADARRDATLPRVTQDLLVATRIELLIAIGRLKQAAPLVSEEFARARSEGHMARAVELSLDAAAIALSGHNSAQAIRHISRAVNFAAKRQHVRPFRDRQSLLAALVNQTRPKDWRFALKEEQSFFAALCRDLPPGSALLADSRREIGTEPALSNPPTERELTLLGLIEAGLSNQQIADHLSMSVPTVKWHLYNLYAKLGVNSRAAALARARGLNLLAR